MWIGWRREATVSLVCVALVMAWVWITGLNLQPFWLVVFSVTIALGFVSGLAGVRRGGRASRVASGACALVLLAAGVGLTLAVRLDPWLYP